MAAYDLAVDEGDGSVEVLIGDVSAAAEVGGLARPGAGRDLEDEVVGWTYELSRGVDDESAELTLALPLQFQDPSFALAADEDLGLDVGAMERYAAIRAAQFQMLVMAGDLSLSSALDELGGGVVTLGGGEDYEFDLEQRGIDQLGRPTRLAENDGSIALSFSTAAIEEWIAGGDSMAEADDYLAVARALDNAGALGAYFIEADFEFTDADAVTSEAADRVREGFPITESFDIVGIGMTVNDGIVGNAVSYAFTNAKEAEEAMRGIEDAWTTAELLHENGLTIDALFEFQSIEQTDNVVTVQVVSADDRDTTSILNLLFRSEVPLVHS